MLRQLLRDIRTGVVLQCAFSIFIEDTLWLFNTSDASVMSASGLSNDATVHFLTNSSPLVLRKYEVVLRAASEEWFKSTFALSVPICVRMLSRILLFWLSPQLWVVWQLASILVLAVVALLEYGLARWAVKPARTLYLDHCKQRFGSDGACDTECLYCWGEIEANQSSTVHFKCRTLYHTSCLEQWARRGTVATCPKCRSPQVSGKGTTVSAASRYCEVQYKPVDLDVLTMRAFLVGLGSMIPLIICFFNFAFDKVPFPSQWAVRATCVLAMHSIIWLVSTIMLNFLCGLVDRQNGRDRRTFFGIDALVFLPLELAATALLLSILYAVSGVLVVKSIALMPFHCFMLLRGSGAMVLTPKQPTGGAGQKTAERLLKMYSLFRRALNIWFLNL